MCQLHWTLSDFKNSIPEKKNIFITWKLSSTGNCLELSEGKIILHSCRNFLWGCPRDDFKSNDYFKCKYFNFYQIIFSNCKCKLIGLNKYTLQNNFSLDPACHTINKKLNCYTLDPNCQSSAESSLHKDTFDKDTMMIVVLVVVGVVVLILAFVYLWKRLRRCKWKHNINLDHLHFYRPDRGHFYTILISF